MLTTRRKKFLDIASRFQVKSAITYTTLLIIDYRLTAAHGCGCDGQAEAELQGIEPISLKDLARRAIREAILGARLSPGERIAESLLSKQMRVGQNVVREALQELEFLGFVERVPN